MQASEKLNEMKINHMMVATDFSPASEAATEYALMLAKLFSSDITVAHGIDLSVATRSEEAVVGLPVDTLRQESSVSMERTLHRLTSSGLRAQGQTFEAHNVAAAVVGLSRQIETNLLVVGTHGRHGLSKAIVGSVSEGIIRHADCPVLVVGPKTKLPKDGHLSINTIVFATDLHHDAARKAAIALSFARQNVARIYLCHVIVKEGKDLREAVEREFALDEALRDLVPADTYEWCTPEFEVKHGNAGEQILAIAAGVSADLIVLGAKRSASWFTHLREGAVEKVVADATCPVLTISE